MNQVLRMKLLESSTLQRQSANDSEEQFAAISDLKTEQPSAIMGTLDAHNTMITQALHAEAVLHGIKDILFNYAGLSEALRARATAKGGQPASWHRARTRGQVEYCRHRTPPPTNFSRRGPGLAVS